MIYLLLCIVSSSLLMVVFKVAGRRKLDIYNLIVFNYIIASLLGFSISGLPSGEIFRSSWMPFAITIGILFIVVFLLMAYSTNTTGIALTTVAVKMSVILPISFSIIYFREDLTVLKITGIVLAMISVYLSVHKKVDRGSPQKKVLLLPLLLFLGSGIIDTLIKYTQESFLEKNGTVMFSSVLFLIAALSGILYAPFRKKPFSDYIRRDTLLAGTILGLINFGSLYGIVMALDSRILDSSVIFGINNMGIVVLSLVFALLFFNEKLSKKNKAGVLLSIITIILLALV